MAANKQQEAMKAELKAMLKRPENTRCADCNTQGPTWASTNLGVFVCMRCSGIHRSLGTHISKVKSTVLDNWQPHMVARMDLIGNAVGKRIYEHGVPSNYPRNFTDQHQLVSWITNKYSNKKWYNERADPELGGASDDDDYQESIHAPSANANIVRGSRVGAPQPVSAQSSRVVAPSASHVAAEPDLFHPQRAANANHVDFADFTGYSGHAVSNPATPAAHSFDAFAAPPAHAHSLPASPAHGTPAFAFQGAAPLANATAGAQNEPDLFALPHAPANGAAAAPSAPKPVDKSALMNIYNQTSLASQQQTYNQQHQLFLLQQQAFLQQQQQFQQQLAQQHAWTAPHTPSPTHNANPTAHNFAAPSPAYAAPFPNTHPTSQHLAPNTHSNAFHGFAASPTTATTAHNNFGAFSASPAPATAPSYPSSPASHSLASIYAQSPPTGLAPASHQANSYSFTSSPSPSYSTASASLI